MPVTLRVSIVGIGRAIRLSAAVIGSKVPCYSPLKGFQNVQTGGWQSRRENAGAPMEVACGQCLGCRLDRSRMWAMRICHEAALPGYHGRNCFITLTYDEEHMPVDWSLDKEHFKLFMKRLRKRFSDKKIKFFHVGEYGNRCRHGEVKKCDQCTVGRPHYHAILFGLMFDDLVVVGSRDGEAIYSSPTLESIWKKGVVQVGEVNFKSAAYCARYCLKKITGALAEEHYVHIDDYGVLTVIEPEYVTMSRGGRKGKGIGYEWFKKFKGDVFPSDEVPVPGQGVIKGVPRYYAEIYADEDVEGMDAVKRERQRFRKRNIEEYSPSRLMQKYKVKKAQVGLLRRTIE